MRFLWKVCHTQRETYRPNAHLNWEFERDFQRYRSVYTNERIVFTDRKNWRNQIEDVCIWNKKHCVSANALMCHTNRWIHLNGEWRFEIFILIHRRFKWRAHMKIYKNWIKSDCFWFVSLVFLFCHSASFVLFYQIDAFALINKRV